MRTVVNKIYWDYEREERWLNEMSANGYALVDYFIARYVFENSAPGEYIYRIELLKKRHANPESKNYIAFMEENGAEHVASYINWVYFRKKTADGPFDIYSDLDSKTEYFKRIRGFYIGASAAQLISGFYNILFGTGILLHGGIFYVNLFAGILVSCIGVWCSFLIYKTNKKIKKLGERMIVNE